MHTASDITLLLRWRDERDAQAFRTLTQRYGGFVFGTCNRVLKNPADAEEVAQDCFLKLATHPASAEQSVGPWLHSVAVRGSLDRMRGERRRRDREQRYEAERNLSETHSAAELLGHIDEAIDELPETLRTCVVRHFLEQRTQEEVADLLGISERTVRRRTREAIERIRQALQRRGVKSGAAALATALAGLKAGAAPPALDIALGKLAIGGETQAATGAALKSAGTALKTTGGLLVMEKGILIALVAAIALAAWWISSGPSVERAGTAAMAPAAPSEVTDASIPVATVQDIAHDTEAPRDAAPPASASGLNSALWSRAPEPGAFTPERIENPTKYASIAGLVLDEQGIAIPGAKIRVLLHGGDLSTIEGPARTGEAAREAVLMDLWENEAYRRKAVCDASGAFVLDGIPYTGAAMVTANAPGYTVNTTECALEAETAAEVTLTLRPALAVRGIVVTPSGKPVAGALVDAEGQVGEFASKTDGPTREYLRVRTDERGEFSLWMLQFGEPGTMFTAVNVKSAEHGEALFYPVAIGSDEPIRLVLEPKLGRLAGKIRLGDAQPATGYHVILQGRANYAVDRAGSMTVGQGHCYEAVTDENGDYEIDDVATFLGYTVTLYNPGKKNVAKQQLPELKPDETTWDYSVAPAIQVTGVVRGIGTQIPISGATVFYRPAARNTESGPLGDILTADEHGAFEATITSGEGFFQFIPRHQKFMMASKGATSQGFESVVELHAGENPPVILELPLPWTRQFRIVDQFGQPVEGARAMAEQQIGGRMLTFRRSERTDAGGLVVLDLLDPRLETAFHFSKEGYITAVSAPALGEPGETRDLEIFVLYQSAGLSARLTGGSGEPLAALPVTCTATYGDRTTTATATTDGEGWLVLDQALPGTEVDLHLEVTVESEGKLLQSHIDGVSLAAGMMNDLATVTLVPKAP